MMVVWNGKLHGGSMDRPLPPGPAMEVLGAFLGHWNGTTHWEATAWNPAHTDAVEIAFAGAAGGHAVAMTYRHTDPDGSCSEGVGVFAEDPLHANTFWYRTTEAGMPLEGRDRATLRDDTLTVERRRGSATIRHVLSARDDVLMHSAGVWLHHRHELIPLMTTVCQRVPNVQRD